MFEMDLSSGLGIVRKAVAMVAVRTAQGDQPNWGTERYGEDAYSGQGVTNGSTVRGGRHRVTNSIVTTDVSGPGEERRGDSFLRRRVLPILFVVVIGIALGVPIAELTGYLPSPWYFLAQIATPWLVASFWAGYLCRRAIAGAIAGTAVIIVGLISHVAYKSIAYGTSSVRPLLDVIVYWTILAVCLGSAMGVAGVLSHSDRTWIRAYAWALPPAVAAIEAVAIAMGLLSYGVKIAVVVGASASLLFVIGAARSNVEQVAVATISLVICGLALFAVVQRSLPLF